MARKSNKDNNELLTIIIALPIIIFAFFFYKKLSNTYLKSENIQKVNDIKRLLFPIMSVGGMIVLHVIILTFPLDLYDTSPVISILLLIIIFISVLICSYFGAKYLAIMYLGILFDFENKTIICPYDFESYGIHDYLSFNFLKTFTQVHCIPAKEVTKITRGYGNELYLHGKFGSNKIKMSSKQKRDECLALATELIGKKGVTFSELESY